MVYAKGRHSKVICFLNILLIYKFAMMEILSFGEFEKERTAKQEVLDVVKKVGFKNLPKEEIEKQEIDYFKRILKKDVKSFLNLRLGETNAMLEGFTKSFPLSSFARHVAAGCKPKISFSALPKHLKQLSEANPNWFFRLVASPVNAKNSVSDLFWLKDWQFSIVDNEDGTQTHIVVLLPLLKNNIKIMDEAMRCFGYYRSYMYRLNGVMDDWGGVQYEQRVQEFVNEKIREEEFLYHVSPTNLEHKTLKQGLVPKSKNNEFDYPDRVYLLRGSEENISVCFVEIADFLCNTKNNENQQKEYTVYKIDTKKVGNANFCIDYNYAPFGVFTADNIPPGALSVLKRITVK